MNPRRVAVQALIELEATPRHLEHLLANVLDGFPKAQPRDKAMAANLIYAVQRHRLWLDFLLSRRVNRPLEGLDLPVLAALRLGAADLVILHTPPHAAVHGAVDAAKANGGGRAAGLVNGALRALSRALPGALEEQPPGDEAQRLSVRYSHPAWLVRELLARWGGEALRPWLEANQSQQPVAVRANTLRCGRDELREVLAPAVDAALDHPLSPDALVLRGVRGPLERLPGFRRGLWQAQDAGAQALGRLPGVRPGMRVLDLCAGAGGKTGHLAALMENRGRIVAVDQSSGRINALAANMRRLGVDIVEAVQAPAQEFDPGAELFDAVLVDAPCSGLGVLGRRPDARWRRGRADSRRLAALQLELLKRAADMLAPGGVLLYCTCTVTAAENEDVAAALLAARPALRPDWRGAGADEALLGPDGYWRSFPRPMEADSFFAARLVRAA